MAEAVAVKPKNKTKKQKKVLPLCDQHKMTVILCCLATCQCGLYVA